MDPSSNWAFDSQTAVLDTGASGILVPPSIYYELAGALLHANPYFLYNSIYYGPCTVESYPSLYLSLGNEENRFFEVPPSSFLDVRPNVAFCALLFQANPRGESWILGDAFLRNYYTVWDHE